MSDVTPAATQAIDFERYRTADLGERIVDMLGLAGRLFSLLKTTFTVAVLSAFVAFVVLLGEATWIRLLGTGYGLFGGALLGVGTAVVWLVHVELRKTEELLDLLLQTTARISNDLARSYKDPSQRPSPSELIPQVYEQVFLPLIASAVKAKFGLFGRPVVWLLRFALGGAVKKLCATLASAKVGWGSVAQLVKRSTPGGEGSDAAAMAEALPAPTPSPPLTGGADGAGGEQAPAPAAEVEAAPTDEVAVAAAKEKVDDARGELASLRGYVRQVGTVMRRFLWPAWIALLFGAALLATPLLLLAWFAG